MELIILDFDISGILTFINLMGLCNPTRKTKNGGMSKNVKANIEALGCEVTIVTNPNNIKKIRYVDNSLNQLVLRVDEHDCCKQINEKQLKYFNVRLSLCTIGFILNTLRSPGKVS